MMGFVGMTNEIESLLGRSADMNCEVFPFDSKCTLVLHHDDYVNAPDDSYKWTLNNTIQGATYTAYILELTSQTWMTTTEVNKPVWMHWVSIGIVMLACTASDTITVGLTQIPNQPLVFDDGKERSEDALIAFTWRKFINNTNDPLWLARLPMTKAVVKCMDAVQEFGKQVPYTVSGFVIAGASKRGWTTWTTAAVDSRVVAAVPIVMPILDMVKNMGHQWQSYGNWTFALNDYLAEGVMGYLNQPQMAALAAVVDPYSYMSRLTMPKYVICSTGDEFFQPDSPSFFFSQLPGEKHLRLVPNAEHSLIGHQTDIVVAIVTFLRMFAQNQARPQFTYNIVYNANNTATITLTVPQGSMMPSKVKAWRARTESTTRRDFRLITCTDPTTCIQPILWFDTHIEPVNNVYTHTVAAPNVGWNGFFLEAEYIMENPAEDEYTLKFTSEVAVVPNTLPFPPCGDNCQPYDL
eukprot:gene3424-3889_t